MLDTEALPNAVVDMALEEVGGTVRSAINCTDYRVASQGAFARNGLKAGDQLLAVNGQRVRNLEDVRTILQCQERPQRNGGIYDSSRSLSRSGRVTNCKKCAVTFIHRIFRILTKIRIFLSRLSKSLTLIRRSVLRSTFLMDNCL